MKRDKLGYKLASEKEEDYLGVHSPLAFTQKLKRKETVHSRDHSYSYILKKQNIHHLLSMHNYLIASS